jgi:ferredoxin-NADP reductase
MNWTDLGVVEAAGLIIILGAVIQVVMGFSAIALRTADFQRKAAAELGSFKRHTKILLEQAKVERARTEASWNGKRKFRIDRRVVENEAGDICSFYLAPHDGRPVPSFHPGQFLTFELPIPGEPQPVVRCYSLSDSPHDDYYRVSIKLQGPPPNAPEGTPPGRSSSFFHNHLKEGDIVEAMAPAGGFYLNEETERGVVLIGGGVGLTPVVSMLNSLIARGSNRDIWFFYGIRNREEHAMADHLREMDRAHPNVHVVVCYSRPDENCEEGVDYNKAGFVSVELFKSLLESNNYEFYICGPPPMMDMVTKDLEEWGVPEKDINFEAFGPATVKKTQEPDSVASESQTIEVVFAKSDRNLNWETASGTLLEFGEANGIKMNSGCRSGSCGTCLTALKEGEIEYVHRPGKKPEAGSCLVCIARPVARIVLDA